MRMFFDRKGQMMRQLDFSQPALSHSSFSSIARMKIANIFGALIVGAGLVWNAGAQARVIDLARSTCAQFISLAPVEKEQIVLWLAGYYAGSAQRPMMDISLLSNASRSLNEICLRTPALPLIGPETRPLLLGPTSP